MNRFAGVLLLVLAGCSVSPSPSGTPSPSVPRRVSAELVPTGDMPVEASVTVQALQAAQEARQSVKALSLAQALEPAAARSSDLSDFLGGFYLQQGALDRALPLVRQALALAPKSAAALLHLGQLEQELGYSKPAGEHLRAARELAPDVASVHLALARFLERELHLPEGEAERREAVALDPQNPGVLGELASNLIKQQRYDEAKKVLTEADRFAPDAPPGLLQRVEIAWEEARRGGGKPEERYAEMEKWLALCLKVAPGYPAALYGLGNLKAARGDDAGAQTALEEALARAPELEGLKIQLGQVLVRRGQRERGIKLIQEHRRAQERRETRDRLVSRVAMQPESSARRQELIRWCLANGEAARARLEQAELARQAPSRTGK